jgi:hypothetical protein
MKAFIFQGRHDTVVVIAENSIVANRMVIDKMCLEGGNDDYYLAGSVWCNEGACVSVQRFIDTK